MLSFRRKIILFEVIFLSIIFGILYQIQLYQKELTKLSNERINMLFAADRLRQSSNDLSHFVRAYVATGNKKFKYQYFRVLNIRNGIVPRPKDYYGIYWELNETDRDIKHPLTKNLALNDILNDLPFTKKELNLLQQSHKESDDLVELEKQAFYLVDRGRKKEALKIVFSDEYYKAKAKIMNPIDEFIISVNNRMKKLVEKQNKKISFYFNVLIISVLCDVFFSYEKKCIFVDVKLKKKFYESKIFYSIGCLAVCRCLGRKSPRYCRTMENY